MNRTRLKSAAAVILLRPAPARGFEVLLIRRPSDMAFVGGTYCFPGGTLRQEDCSDRMLARSRGLTPNDARAILGAHFSPRMALGLWLAAIRQLFEDTGILLVTGTAGTHTVCDKSRILELHSALLAKTASFQTLLEKDQLLCDSARLAYFSHWQTPVDVTARFDTYFFVAALPEDQSPLAASSEVDHSLWLTPDYALQLFGELESPMTFPIFASLRTLADFDSMDRVMKSFQLHNGG